MRELNRRILRNLFLASELQCAVERSLLLAGANPAQQLSLRLVAAKADHRGNDMV